MHVNIFFANNPFFDAYFQSDLLGKCIFLSLYALSICSWIILIHKIWTIYQARKYATRFHEAFLLHKQTPLNLEFENIVKQTTNPFLDLYKVLKKRSLELLAKNRHFNDKQKTEDLNFAHSLPSTTHLSLSDMDFVGSHLAMMMAMQTKKLEKNLYLLSTTVSLAPFLGLLGTVWGILMTFSEMQSNTAGGHQMVLGGLSLALATTVLGLVDAIPALIGYNYLKNTIRDFSTEMEVFSNEILTSVELQYRKVEN